MLRRLKLLPKIWLSTSVALTALFGIAVLVFQRHAVQTTSHSLAEEVRSSFEAYDSLWNARAETLNSVAAILSSMPNVRAAFSTGDPATIRDTALEVWSKVSDSLRETAFFVVTSADGVLLASLDNKALPVAPSTWPVVRAIRDQFPKQVSGFMVRQGELYQVVVTPVYVDSARGSDLLNVLVAGYHINHLVAQRFKKATGGSDFLFLSGKRVFASTLNERATAILASRAGQVDSGETVNDGVSEYIPLSRELTDLEGHPAGKLLILRSFDGARQQIGALRRNVLLLWIAAMIAGLALTYGLARRIVQPIDNLDRAAAEVAKSNYAYRVKVESDDEFGRLAATFNQMCESLETARDELIRQERISTIGRLASSIVHDLRNPLAAVYGGAEMLVDTDLPQNQQKRLAENIYRASRRIQEMLNDLANVARGKAGRTESCSLRDIVDAAVNDMKPTAEQHEVQVHVDVPDVELQLERARMERVFLNLIGNAIEVMPGGGEVRITTARRAGSIEISVEDTGPGIAPEIRSRLFQPFVTAGKRNGLGLGLALSRQTVVDHGGDMWAEQSKSKGARFLIRLPAPATAAAAAAPDRVPHPTIR